MGMSLFLVRRNTRLESMYILDKVEKEMRMLKLPKAACEDGQKRLIDPTMLNATEWWELWCKTNACWADAIAVCFSEGPFERQLSHGTLHFSEVDCDSKTFLNRKVCCIQFDRRNETTIISWHKPCAKDAPCQHKKT